jgi:hypothetical protein
MSGALTSFVIQMPPLPLGPWQWTHDLTCDTFKKGGREAIFIDLPLALSPVKYILAPLVGGMGAVVWEQLKRKISNIANKTLFKFMSAVILHL